MASLLHCGHHEYCFLSDSEGIWNHIHYFGNMQKTNRSLWEHKEDQQAILRKSAHFHIFWECAHLDVNQGLLVTFLETVIQIDYRIISCDIYFVPYVPLLCDIPVKFHQRLEARVHASSTDLWVYNYFFNHKLQLSFLIQHTNILLLFSFWL